MCSEIGDYMKRMIKYPSIEQFRNVISTIQRTAQFVRYDTETNQVITDPTAKLPVITAIGTEKIHGTNAAVCYSKPDGFWVQSRENIITPQQDNAACAFHAYNNQCEWIDIIENLAEEYDINLNNKIISVYYEWAGAGIQKKSAVSDLDKMAFIFRHFKVSPLEPSESEHAIWLETKIGDRWIDNQAARIFNISNFPTYEIEIDFNQPLLSQNKMIDLVEKVIEPQSPVGVRFGMESNIGEGIVVSFEYKNGIHQFKVKGLAHSNSKVKTLKRVDNEKIQHVQDIAQQVCPAWRLEQMFDQIKNSLNDAVPTTVNTGAFIKAVNQDIIKEESDIIAAAGLEPKSLFPVVANIARQWYGEELDRLAMQ